ncbi:hypothetical protein NMG60_11012286 [Bertholletia excelsa]
MFSFTLELITTAASNSLLIFCFCNLIIAILLIGGSRPASGFQQRSKNAIEETNSTCSSNKNAVENGGELSNEEAVTDEEEDNKDEEDEELRRRVEEFIDKINRGWQAEKLMTSLLI